MAQIVGSKRTQRGQTVLMPPTQASVDRIDHTANGALAVATYDGVCGKKTLIDGNVTYTGWCIAGRTADTDDAIWRIRRETNDGSGNITTDWATVAASGDSPARVGEFEHVWDDYATLTYS